MNIIKFLTYCADISCATPGLVGGSGWQGKVGDHIARVANIAIVASSSPCARIIVKV